MSNKLKDLIKNMKQNEKLYLFLLVFFISLLPALLLNTTIFTDETGTLGYGAFLGGENWGKLISANGSYYKYGQALLYAPLYLLSSEPRLIFKGIMFVNSILVAFNSVIAYKIVSEFVFKLDKRKAFFLALIIGILPCYLLNSKFAWAETILNFLTWVVIYVLLKLVDLKKNSKIKKIWSILLAFSSCYAYMSHQRGVVIVIAVLIVIFMARFFLKKDLVDYKYFFSSILLMFIIDKVLCNYFINVFFGEGGIQANTVESSIDFKYLFKIFSIDGFIIIVKELSGWCFAFIISTLGVGLYAFIVVSKYFINLVKLRFKKDTKEIVFYLFSILIFVGALVLGILFFYKAIFQYYAEDVTRRADRLIYTRYLDSVCGPMILIGIWQLCFKETKKEKVLFTLVPLLTVILIAFILFIGNSIDDVSLWTALIASIAYLVNTTGMNSGFTKVPNLSGVLYMTYILTSIIFIYIVYEKKRVKKLYTLIISFLLVYLLSFCKIIYPVNKNFYKSVSDVTNVLELFEVSDISKNYRNLYVEENLYREAIQFHTQGYDILTKQDESYLTYENMFIVSPIGNYNQELYKDDYYEFVEKHNSYKFHVYVKGESLKNELINKGVSLRKVEAFTED